MSARPFTALLTISFASILAGHARANDSGTMTLICASAGSERQHCQANTSSGILLSRSTGSGACLLGRTWGYDDAGVWVQDGCSAEFIVAAAGPRAPGASSATQPASVASATAVTATSSAATASAGTDVKEQAAPSHETYGYLDPGKGFLVGKTDLGELSISGYALVRYMNQMDDDEVFVDHLGRERPVDGREDIYSHRVLVWLN